MKVRITKYIFPLIILFISVTTVAQNFGVDGYLYKMQEDNTVAVTGHNDKTITEIDVPKMVIYNNIYFPITKIEAGAFSYFSKVTNVILSDNITEIGNTAFSYCYNMENLKLPSKLVKIGNSGFSNCGSLTGIKLPQTLEEIGTAAFQHCYKLTELTFPSQVKEVKSNTFLNCLSLTTINIHKDIISVAPDFVRFCSRLKNINVDSDNLYYKDIDGAFYNKTGDSLIVMPGDNDKYTIDPATKYILKNTFACCSMKPNLEIPASVISIPYDAFIDYNKIENFKVDNNNQHFAGKDGVIYSKDMKTLKFCPQAKSGEFDIEKTVTTIDYYAFYNCKNLTAVTFPQSLTTIMDYAFSDCSGLTQIELPESLKNIYSYGFSGCGITTLRLPENITGLGYYCFMSCKNLESVVISSKSLKYISNHCFRNCSNLKDIEMPESIESIGDRGFSSCSKLESFIFHEGIKTLGSYIFEECSSLKMVYLPSTLEKMDSNCLAKMKSLSEVYLNKTEDINKKENILTSSSISDATLYVPTGTKTMYESLSPWSGFGNITEHESLNTSLKYLSEEKVLAITINNGILRIENSQAGETILIINSNGCIINSLKGNNETIDINVSDKGLLLVKAGDKILKIIN